VLQKTEQLKRLTEYLITKYGEENIIVTDYWDADEIAVGLADKSKQYTVYVADYGTDNFFVSLENPAIGDDLPYSKGDEFDNFSANQVEVILIRHLKIV